jgi:hypothetical protein
MYVYTPVASRAAPREGESLAASCAPYVGAGRRSFLRCAPSLLLRAAPPPPAAADTRALAAALLFVFCAWYRVATAACFSLITCFEMPFRPNL